MLGNGDGSFGEPTSYEVGASPVDLTVSDFNSLDPANGNVLSTTYADGTRINYTYTDNGLVETMTDQLGRVNDYSYDELGRLNGIIFAAGTLDAASVRYEYDAAGNQTAFIDENGSRTEYAYDEMNQLVSITEADPDGDGALISPITTFVYDTAGNLIGTIDASGNSTRSTYDSVDRLISTVDPNGSEAVYTYDSVGNLISFKDPLNQTTRSLYDERNRLIVSTDAEGNSTRYSYDIDNNTTEIIDPNGNKTTWRYDARSRVLSETDPLGNSTVYRYDTADNLTAILDRNDRLIEFEYDELNRPTKEIWIGDNQVIEYQYDLVGNLLAVADQFSSLAFTYDNRDRLLSVDNSSTPNVPNVLLNYTYDSVGNILSVTDSIDGNAGGTNTYTYDDLNRLIQLTQTGNNVSDKRVNMNYNPLSQLSEIQRYADIAGTQLVVNTNYTYDTLDRLTNLNHSNSTTNLAFYNLVYDEASRITQIENIDGTTDYTYDKRSQLLGAEYSNSAVSDESYTYDENGNRVSSTQHEENYQTGTNNRLLSDGVYNYEYDLSGNLIRRSEIATDAVREFEWDYRNRLVGIIDKDAQGNEIQRVEFTYDAMNRRIAKTVDGVVTYFVYDGDNVLLDFVDTDGVDGEGVPVLAQRYLHGAGVDQILAQEDGSGNVVWHLADHLGTIRDLVDSSGEVVNHLSYDSYGNVVAETDDTVDSRYLYTGRELDAETGLYYYRARYYDAQVGRFLSEAPISFAAGDANLYRYVENSPINSTDPLGLLVTAVFEISKGKLTVVDNDTGATATATAFTGNWRFRNNPDWEDIPSQGSIPLGVYDILFFPPEPNWYRLDIQDSEPLNDQYDDEPPIPGFPRGQFRLHAGRISLGCVTVPKDNIDEWNRLIILINSTTTEIVEDRFGAGEGFFNNALWLRNQTRGKTTRQFPLVTKYGTLIVVR